MADTVTNAASSDPLWADWDTPPRVPGIPELHLTGLDGPMDLLLDLAERQRIDVGRISILQLAEQFVAALHFWSGTSPSSAGLTGCDCDPAVAASSRGCCSRRVRRPAERRDVSSR